MEAPLPHMQRRYSPKQTLEDETVHSHVRQTTMDTSGVCVLRYPKSVVDKQVLESRRLGRLAAHTLCTAFRRAATLAVLGLLTLEAHHVLVGGSSRIQCGGGSPSRHHVGGRALEWVGAAVQGTDEADRIGKELLQRQEAQGQKAAVGGREHHRFFVCCYNGVFDLTCEVRCVSCGRMDRDIFEDTSTLNVET